VKSHRIGWIVSALTLVTAANSFGETISAKRISATNRLIPLKKVTVGPDDQYRGVVDPTGSTLVFTRKSDMVPHLCRQEIASGQVTDFLQVTADSQEPAISPDGSKVAFTYYKFNARGDICYQPLGTKPPVLGKAPEEKITCLAVDAGSAGSDGEKSSPFWKSADELGFVVRDLTTQNSKIISEKLSTGARQVLVSGKVWSPAMKAGGRYLVYNKMQDDGANSARILAIKDLVSNTEKVVKFTLPGISGFPAISEDENYLFFSHYFDDTNHDNVIDGNDNSVVFRASLPSILAGNEVFPEQLTSVDSNCSFVKPYKDQLFMTCGFEGGLDIYQMAQTGIVPVQWNNDRLWNAHQTARSYSDRLLLLNTLKFRNPGTAAKSQSGVSDLEDRVLSDHLLADDTTASKFYLKRRQQDAGTPKQRSAFDLLHIYLEALELKRSQPSEDEVSPVFRKQILGFDEKMVKISGSDRFRTIFRGLLRTFLADPAQSLTFLKQVSFKEPAVPMERDYYFQLALWTVPRTKGPINMVDIYRQVMSAPEFSEESQIYYAFRFLQYLAERGLSLGDRVAVIDKMSATAGMPAQTVSLLKSESAALRIIQAKDDPAKTKVYGELDKLMTASSHDYFLRKALYVRAILNFSEAAEFKYLDFVASNWLRYTANDDTEFAYSREVYSNATLDRAYDSLGAKKYQIASDYFYGSLSLTDDLESHFGYIESMMLRNQRKVIDDRYQNLVKRQFVEDNMKYVEALLILIDAKPSSREDVGYLDQALEKLSAMDQDRDSPVRYLLMGYCYLEKVLKLAKGYEFDQSTFEAADRNLMLAYDLGRDNDRIRASTLIDLGILHTRVQNPGLAAKYFAKRKAFGFDSPDEKARFAWLYSNALYYSNQPALAAAQLNEVFKELPAADANPFYEHWAFYLQASGNYPEAVSAYRDLLAKNRVSGDLNLAKAHLSYGYVLFETKKFAESRAELLKSLDSSKKLTVIKSDANRLIDFEPLRLKLDAYGLLARMGTPAERLDALENRNQLLDQAKGLYDDVLTLKLENRVQAAAILTASSPEKALPLMTEALKLTEQLGDSGQYLSHAVFQATVDFLSLGILHPQLYKSQDASTLKKVVDQSLSTYAAQKSSSPVLAYQKVKLSLLWNAYSEKVLMTASHGSARAKQEDELLDSAPPAMIPELKKLRAALN
jgi:hypothetical protein